jgi:sortase A
MDAILPVNRGLLLYCHKVFRSLRVSVLLILLAALVLAALPVLPLSETAATELNPAEVETAGTLLGENSPELRTPPERVQPTGGRVAGTAETVTLTVPELGLKDVAVSTGSSQAELDREGIMHLEGTGVPWQAGSNTFIVGHALGFMRTRVPYVFYELDKLEPGDEIIAEDSNGGEYVFRVYDLMTVRPADYWVTYPEDGRTIISLQTCVPAPTFQKRLVVRGELVS